jgi:hypothetical protein
MSFDWKAIQGFASRLVMNTRVSAFVVVASCLTLCRATTMLCRAAINGRSVVGEMAIVVGSLVTLVGYAYGRNKLSDERGLAGDSIKKDVIEPEREGDAP